MFGDYIGKLSWSNILWWSTESIIGSVVILVIILSILYLCIKTQRPGEAAAIGFRSVPTSFAAINMTTVSDIIKDNSTTSATVL